MDASKVWEWLARNERFGIVIAFAAICVFVGQYFNAWPFTLVQDGLGTLLVGGLLGLGLIIVATSRWVKAVSASGINSFQEWYERHTVMNRVDELTGPQKAALMWIALNPKESVSGSRFEEPFQALVEKKYLFAAD